MSEPHSTPLISVIMPCYNESLGVLDRALDSVLGQTHSNLELLAVCDNPLRTDVLEHLRHRQEHEPRLRVLVNEENIGVWPSCNRGLRAAAGEYIAIQDADDASAPERLERLLSHLLEHPEIDLVGCALEYVDETTGRTLMTRHYPENVSKEIRRRCPLGHATTLRRSGLHERFGFYDESKDVAHAADYELWFRWFVQGVRMANIPECHYYYYQSGENFKSRNVLPILRDTVAIKKRYRESMGFGLGDTLYLWAEEMAAHLPSRAVVFLFYLLTGARSRRWAGRDAGE